RPRLRRFSAMMCALPAHRSWKAPRTPSDSMPGPFPPVFRLPGEGPTIAVVGDVYRFLVLGTDTDGTYSMWHATVPPGGGPPPHIHRREEEGFYILEGQLVLYVEQRRVVVEAGTFAHVPIGALHHFRNESDRPTRLLIWVAPAGLEQMFLEVGTPVDPST